MARIDPLTARDELLGLGVAPLTRAFHDAICTPVDVLEALQSAIEEGDELINAFCHLDWQQAFEAARESALRYRAGAPLGPLDGVPVSVKDLTDVRGWPTRRGSLVLAEAGPASDDAPAVALLRRGGAVLFGKTNTTEFGWTIRSDNPLDGLTRNPIDPAHSAGGSSSGAAAHVAAGWGPLALGSDAGGSVRIPASYCGLVGFKPTFGAIPMVPSSAFTEFAHLGPLSRSVDDCRAAMQVLSRPDPRDLASTFFRKQGEGSRPVRVGWTLLLGSGVQPDEYVTAAFHSSLEQLRAAGCHVQEVDARAQDCADAMWQIWRSRMVESFSSLPAPQWDKLGAGLRQLYREGEAMSMADLSAARIRLRQMAVDLGRVFSDIDVLLTPMTPGGAPLALEPDQAERAPAENWFLQSGYSYPFNITGQPALSLPMGRNPQGLPLGLQIVGHKFHDVRVLEIGAQLEGLLSPAGAEN